jgi:hypothetical protein
MSTEGTDLFETLQAERQAAGDEVARCQADASALDGQINDLLYLRGKALLDLARRFLPTMSRPAVEATFADIRADLLDILARKEKRQIELRKGQDAGAEEARRHEAEIGEVTRRLNEKVAERERLEAEVVEVLKHNADFQERSKLALQAEEQLHRNEQRVTEMQKEAAEKLPHYEQSRLFRYLYERHYGTPEYQCRGLILELDRWVAGLIRFNEARAGYDFLKKTPELVAAEVSRRRDQFHELMQQVEAIQHAEAERAGLTAVLKEGEELGERRDALVQELEQVRQKTEGLKEELAGLDREQNAFYTEALERFRKFLGETRVALLEQRARQSPEPEDDAIVAQVAALDRRLDELKPRLPALADRRRAAERTREGIDQVVLRYRQSNFDSRRSYFEDALNPRQILEAFRSGEVDADTVWSELRSNQRFRPHWVESAAGGASDMVTGPTGRVILGAVVEMANQAMRDAAYRGVRRRSDFRFPGPMSFPMPQSKPMPSPRQSAPAPSEGSFTSGEGF